ncbi:hypothetical protein D9M69_583630 [compost metagenome]
MSPAAVIVPTVSRFVFEVFNFPSFKLNVPLKDKGEFRVTPDAFPLVTTTFEKFAVGAAARFLIVPLFVICCGLRLGLKDTVESLINRVFTKKNPVVEVSIPPGLITALPFK